MEANVQSMENFINAMNIDLGQHQRQYFESPVLPNLKSGDIQNHSPPWSTIGLGAGVCCTTNDSDNTSLGVIDPNMDIENICDSSSVDDAIMRLSWLVSTPESLCNNKTNSGTSLGRVKCSSINTVCHENSGNSSIINCTPVGKQRSICSLNSTSTRSTQNDSRFSFRNLADLPYFNSPKRQQLTNGIRNQKSTARFTPLKVYQDKTVAESLCSPKVGIVIKNGKAMTFEEKLSRSASSQNELLLSPNRVEQKKVQKRVSVEYYMNVGDVCFTTTKPKQCSNLISTKRKRILNTDM